MNAYKEKGRMRLQGVWGLALLGLLACSLQARGQLRLQVLSDTHLPRGFRIQEVFADSAALSAGLLRLTEGLRSASYLEASVDSLWSDSTLWRARLHIGPSYHWQRLSPGSTPQAALRFAGFRESRWPGKPVEQAALDRLLDRLLSYATNHGYPFAQAGLQPASQTGSHFGAELVWNAGPYVVFDSLLLEGAPLKNRFVQRYLGVPEGSPYRQDAVWKARDRLRSLAYAQLRTDPELRFGEDKVQMVLDLAPRNASRFDFLIGILPNSTQVNRLLITGTLEAELQNQFRAGERIYARFEQLRPQTQRLDFHAQYPYLLGLPVGADMRFHFYKRDTSFLDVEADIGIQYLLEGNDYLKVFWIQRGSRLLGFNTEDLIRNNRLPANLDVRNRFFGLEISRQRLDYRFNPRKGWGGRLSFGAGAKQIVPNGRIQELGLEFLYDSLTLRSTQYRIDGRADVFVPVFRRSTVHYALQGRWLLSAQPVLRNEQFRIGGNRLLRGFDEEFFQVTHFAINTLEYRMLLSENSYLYGFADAGWAEDSTPQGIKVFYPFGLGAGMTFETRSGIFGISLAYGARWGEPINLNSPKVHLGYVSLF